MAHCISTAGNLIPRPVMRVTGARCMLPGKMEIANGTTNGARFCDTIPNRQGTSRHFNRAKAVLPVSIRYVKDFGMLKPENHQPPALCGVPEETNLVRLGFPCPAHLRKRKARESAVPSPDRVSPDPLFRFMPLPDTFILSRFEGPKVQT